MTAETITDDTFDTEVLTSDKPVLVDFWAEWCGPCKRLSPNVERIAEDMSDDLSVYKMNVDENPMTMAKYGVRGLPTLILFKNGKVTATVPQRESMTIRHLLSYTSGLGYARDWPAALGMNQRDILSLDGDLETMVAKLSKFPLLAQPGERWIYGFHSDVLARIVEVVSGQPFNVFLRERIFEPLEMRDTGFWVQRGAADRLATVYTASGNENGAPLVARPATPSSTYDRPGSFFSGGGGLVSTVPDYLRFAQMLANGGTLDGARILQADTVAEMGTNQLRATGSPLVGFGYDYNPPSVFAGYGWGLSIGVRVAEAVHSVPGSPGDMTWGGLANTIFFIDRKRGLVAVAMAQYVGPGSDALAFRLREGVYQDFRD